MHLSVSLTWDRWWVLWLRSWCCLSVHCVRKLWWTTGTRVSEYLGIYNIAAGYLSKHPLADWAYKVCVYAYLYSCTMCVWAPDDDLIVISSIRIYWRNPWTCWGLPSCCMFYVCLSCLECKHGRLFANDDLLLPPQSEHSKCYVDWIFIVILDAHIKTSRVFHSTVLYVYIIVLVTCILLCIFWVKIPWIPLHNIQHHYWNINTWYTWLINPSRQNIPVYIRICCLSILDAPFLTQSINVFSSGCNFDYQRFGPEHHADHAIENHA